MSEELKPIPTKTPYDPPFSKEVMDQQLCEATERMLDRVIHHKRPNPTSEELKPCPIRALIEVSRGFLRNPRHDISCTYDPDGCDPDTDFCTCKHALPKAIQGAEEFINTRAASPLLSELSANLQQAVRAAAEELQYAYALDRGSKIFIEDCILKHLAPLQSKQSELLSELEGLAKEWNQRSLTYLENAQSGAQTDRCILELRALITKAKL